MAINMSVVFVVGLLMMIGLFSVTLAETGTATFYTEYTPCYGNQDQGLMIATASHLIWNNGAACGKFYTVRCIGATNQGPEPCRGGTVRVKIVDYSPPGCAGTIDLSKMSFAMISNPDAGKIRIEFNQQILIN